MEMPKLWIAPLSPEIVKVAKEFNVGFIISENQLNPKGGYTGWTYESLRKELPDHQIWRDHSSCNEQILKEDCRWLNGIHIDPFKLHPLTSVYNTFQSINFIHGLNSKIKYEVGTEEAVFPYDFISLNLLLENLFLCSDEIINNIEYAVIQCGTALKNGENIGVFNEERAIEFRTVCKLFNIIPKEHNGDYQGPWRIAAKNRLFKDNFAINIAPEIGSIQSEEIFKQLSSDNRCKMNQLIISNPNFNKWVDKDFDLNNLDDVRIARIGGHYIYQNEEFQNIINRKVDLDRVEFEIQMYLEDILYALK